MSLYDQTVELVHKALEQAYDQAVKNRPRPDRSDAIRVTWDLVKLASHEVARKQS